MRPKESPLIRAGRRTLSAAAAFATFATTALAADRPKLPDWRAKMQPIIPLGYVARHTATPIVVDGKLDDDAWRTAPWTTDFVDIEGDAKPKPRFRTRAKILWDDHYLYIAAELEEPHVWGKLLQHDAVIFQDPDFEVFLDPDGDTHDYFEFELNALNTGWDLFLPKPYIDGGKARNEWEIPYLKTAVLVGGTLNDPRDTDAGWTLEIAFPWAAFSIPAHPAESPLEGEVWRMNFSRVEWQVVIRDGLYEKIPRTPEDNWVWAPQGVIDMHRPEMWGLVRFTRQPAAKPVVAPVLAGRPARDLALDFYYAQLDFQKTNKRWAASLAELKWTAPAGAEPPVFRATSDGYEFAASFRDGAVRRTWTVHQDRRLILD